MIQWLKGRWAQRRLHRLRQHTFRSFYLGEGWGVPESASGSGSTLEQTRLLREALLDLLLRHKIEVMIDAPCGDRNWMKEVALPVSKYIGIDIVPELIEKHRIRFTSPKEEYLVADLCTDPLPDADLLLCRDAMVHLPFQDIHLMIRNLKKTKITWLLATTFIRREQNQDIHVIGDWRPLNLQCAPFHFPQPCECLIEGCTEQNGQYADKALGLWRLADLPSSPPV